MDLSALSDQDLLALQRGEMGKMSDAGLSTLKNQGSVALSAAAPPAPAAAAPSGAPEQSLFHKAIHGILDYAVNKNPAVGALELGGSAVSGAGAQVVGGLAGLAHEAGNALGVTSGEPADTVRAVEKAGTYVPQTDAAHDLENDAAATAHAVAPVVQPIANKAGELADATGHGPLLRAAADVLPKMAAVAVPALRAAGPEVGAGLDMAALSPEDQSAFAARTPGAPTVTPAPVIGKPSDLDPLATARGAGFKTTASNVSLRNPTQQPSSLEQIKELAGGGNANLTKGNNASNTARATQLAGQQMGLGDDVKKITVPDLGKAKAAPGQDYDLVGSALKDFTPSPNLTNLLKDAQADNSVQSSSASRRAASTILDTIAQNKGTYSGSDIVGDISKLRESQNTRPIANMLEDEMQRQADNSLTPGLADTYRAARQKFAQIFTVQDALAGGQVDPAAIGKVHGDSPNLLTGNLRLIGSAAQELPQDMKLPSAPSGSAIDALLSGTKGILGGAGKKILSSDASQTARFGPQANAGGESYFSTFGEKPKAGAEPLKLALAPGNAGRIMPSEGGVHDGAQGAMNVEPNQRPLIDLQQPEGAVGRLTPVQGNMSVPEGPESITGAAPSSKEANNLIRPLGDAFQPHQHDLFPPNNVSKPKGPAPKVSKPAGISDSDWKLLLSLGLAE